MAGSRCLSLSSSFVLFETNLLTYSNGPKLQFLLRCETLGSGGGGRVQKFRLEGSSSKKMVRWNWNEECWSAESEGKRVFKGISSRVMKILFPKMGQFWCQK